MYRGTQFRSRLEARWAAFFDLIGWSWVYEPLDAAGYIPDFLIKGERPFFVEVGPCIDAFDYEAKASKPASAAAELRRDVLVVGVDVLPRLRTSWSDNPAAGWMGEYVEGDCGTNVAVGEWCSYCVAIHQDSELVFAEGIWTTCRECEGLGVAHDYMSYMVRPCGHHPGGHIDRPRQDVEGSWVAAGNRVQWLRRSA